MANPELEAYIKKEEERGVTPEKIRGALVNSGWNEVDVDIAFAEKDASVVQEEPAEEKTDSEQKAEPENLQRTTLISVVAIMQMVFGSLGIISSIFFLISSSAMVAAFNKIPFLGEAIPDEVGVIFIVVALILFLLNAFTAFIGWSMWNLKKWSRLATIIISIISILTIVGIPFSAFFLYVMFRHDTKQAFGVA